ncbi:MAG: competence protein CoiA family protein [Gammaproteobacteria bacterium]|nr:competence protein CoiA family protein [Gammaproteobacteria bacterium]
MPLSCIDRNSGEVLNATTMPGFAWDELQLQNQKMAHLRMRCCDAEVVLKTSKLGTRFFAHKSKGDCSAKSESVAHLSLKELAFTSAKAHEWDAITEHLGGGEDERWVADVYASKSEKNLAIEIQWTAQTDEETIRRQRRYRESGVLGFWVFRQEKFHTDRHTPGFRVREDPNEGFVVEAHVDLSMQCKDTPAVEFFEHVFTEACQPGIPIGVVLPLSIYVASIKCWRCRRATDIIYEICIGSNYGDYRYDLRVDDFEEHEDLLQDILTRLPEDLAIGEIKLRYSRTADAAYLSNGCFHCDALFGSFYEYRYVYDAKRVRTFNTKIDGEMREILYEKYEHLEDTWGVFTSLRQIESPNLQHALSKNDSDELKLI